MITKIAVNNALMAWEAARDKASLEHAAWGALLQNHKSLIDSMRTLGWTYDKAKSEFDQLSNSHRETYLVALADMDAKCAEYQKIKAAFDNQEP